MARSRAAVGGGAAQNKALTEMAMGYFRSRVLGAAARLGVADALGDEERSVEDLALSCGAQAASLYRLLRALASLGVVAESTPGRFVLSPVGRPMRKDAPDSEWASIVFWADLLADNWSYLEECIRTGDNAMRVMEREGVASRWSKDPQARAIFGAVMGTAPAEDYMPIVRAWDFSKYRAVADLGGGGGALLSAALHVFPNLRGMLVDHQEFIDQTRLRFEREGLAARCEMLAADLREGVPEGAEVYMLKHVLHGYEDAAAVEILGHCRTVLPAQGRLLVIEFVLPDVVDQADLELEGQLMSDLNMLALEARSAAAWSGKSC